MLPLLEGIRILEIGKSDSVRFCGRILAELGAEVSVIPNLGSDQGDDETHELSRKVFNKYLNQNKLFFNGLEFAVDEEEIAKRGAAVDLCILGYEATYLSHLPTELLDKNTSVVAITPFGLTGPNAKCLGGDLIASHAGGYAYHVVSPSSSPYDMPPTRGPAGQSTLFAGLIGAVSAIGALLGASRGDPPTLIDLSEQEAVVSLLFEELAAYNQGHLPTTRQIVSSAESTAVAGGLVGILPCRDGFVAFSPREQHQWERVVEWLGHPAWTTMDEFSSPSLRMQHWPSLQTYLSERTSNLPKEQVFMELQANKVACFPVNTMKEAFSIEQLESRKFWQVFDFGTRSPSLVLPAMPFVLKTMSPENHLGH